MSRLLILFTALVGLSMTLLADSPKANPFRGEQPVAAPKQVPEVQGDRDFQRGEYRKAAAWYAEIAAADPSILSAEQKGAWAFCRLKLAAESLTSADSQAAYAAEKEAAAALALAPDRADVQKLAQTVLLLARQKATALRQSELPAGPSGSSTENQAVAGDTVETASFVIRFLEPKQRELAQKIAEAAEAKRPEIFDRWSGPVGGAWQPKCTIVLHANAEAYAATGKAAAGTGHASVRLLEGRVTERRIDLRADAEGLLDNALPRELTHVVLADLFPYTPPPKWAEEGMAVIAESSAEVERYRRTCVRCGREGKLFTLAALLEMKEFPAGEKITGFYCGSVSLVEFLVEKKGARPFTTFLRDCQRYGAASALQRHYGFANPQALQAAWLKRAFK